MPNFWRIPLKNKRFKCPAKKKIKAMSALASDTQLKTLNTNHFSGQFKS